MKKVVLALVLAFSGLTIANEVDPNNLFPPKKSDKSKSALPGKVTLAEPAFMAKVSGSTVTLKWAPVETANAYHIQVATDANFKWLVADEALYNGTSFEVKTLEKAKSYYWRVSARKTDNEPTYSQGWFSSSMFETL